VGEVLMVVKATLKALDLTHKKYEGKGRKGSMG